MMLWLRYRARRVFRYLFGKSGHRTTMFGRKVRPMAFWVGYCNVVLIAGVLLDIAVGVTLNGVVGSLLGVPAAAALLLMAAGFWLNKPRIMADGLLLSAALWWTVSIFAIADTWNESISGWIAIGLGGMTTWAWWIEVDEDRGYGRWTG